MIFYRVLLVITITSNIIFQAANAQNKPIVVVDGYFTVLDSTEVFSYLKDKEILDKVVRIDADSAMNLLGPEGVGGIIKLNTTNSRSEHSKYFRSDENRKYGGEPSYFIEEQLQENFDPNAFDFQKVKSIEVIFPLTAVQRFGREFVTGAVVIHIK